MILKANNAKLKKSLINEIGIDGYLMLYIIV